MNQGPQPITIDDLFKAKGELVTQMEVAQSKLQMVNAQIQQILNQQSIVPVQK